MLRSLTSEIELLFTNNMTKLSRGSNVFWCYRNPYFSGFVHIW